MKETEVIGIVQHYYAFFLIFVIMSIGLKAKAQTLLLDSSNVVVGYHYSCNTKNAEGTPTMEEYDIAMGRRMGRFRRMGRRMVI